MKWVCSVILCCSLLLTGCSISLSDIVTAGSATVGAAASTAAGLPVAAVASVTAISGVGGAALVAEPEAPVENPWDLIWRVIRESIHWIIGGTVVLVVIAWLLPGPTRIFGRRID